MIEERGSGPGEWKSSTQHRDPNKRTQGMWLTQSSTLHVKIWERSGEVVFNISKPGMGGPGGLCG